MYKPTGKSQKKKIENLIISLFFRTKLLPQLASNRTRKKSSTISKKKLTYSLLRKQCDPKQLNTFVRLRRKTSLLHVTGLQNRLVISLSESLHDLRSTRFFLLIKSNDSKADSLDSFGFLSFRQDQLHIDLFVFFSGEFAQTCTYVWSDTMKPKLF